MKKEKIIVFILVITLTCGIGLLFPKITKETYAVGMTLADKVIELAGNKTSWSDNLTTGGVYATNSYTATDGSTKYHDYRYVGAEVDNYVSFNNDMYRIIGVFDDYTHGVTGEKLVKLIRSRIIGGYSWGNYTRVANQAAGTYAGSANNWVGDSTNSPANTNILLNQYFYNKTNGLSTDTYGICQNWTYYSSNELYRTNDCSDIVGYGINSDVRNYIETVTWHLNGMIGAGYSKSQFYECERNGSTLANCYSGNSDAYASSTEDEIGLMYASDYLYASGYYGSTNTQTASAYYYGNKNWMYKGYEWTITPDGDSASIAFSIYSGDLYSGYADNPYGVRPSFYLKSSVYITGGDGSFSNPFTVACDDCN